MMAIAIGTITNRVISSSPFCDKNFKVLRVAADAISRLCLALFYKIISISCWPISSKGFHHYKSLANYQWARVGSVLVSYSKFGKEVVDFCANSSTRVKEHFPQDVDEYERLKRMYGNEVIDRWSRIGTGEIPLQIDRLCKKEMGSEGCCLGMSFHFISFYLQQIRLGKSPVEAVKSIAGFYVDGAPEEAECAQIFYAALDTSNLIEAEDRLRQQNSDARREETLRWLAAEEERLHRLIPVDREGFEEEFARVQVEAERRIQNIRTETLSDKLRGEARIHAKREQIIANAMGLAIERPVIYAYEQIEGSRDMEFERFIDQLPNGAYQVAFESEKAHGIVFIKTAEGLHFIHEPNFATLAVRPVEAGARLWEIGRFYLKGGLCSISFSRLSLDL